MRQKTEYAANESNFDSGGRAITEMLPDPDLFPLDYIWIDYPVVKSDSLWGLIRKHWNLPIESGNDKKVKDLVAMTRAYNGKDENWRPRRGDIIKIPTVKISQLPYDEYVWGNPYKTETIQTTIPSNLKQYEEVGSDFAYYPLTQEEAELIMVNSLQKVLLEEYDNFRTKKHIASGGIKFIGGMVAIVGGIICIVGSGGLAIPLIMGTAATTLGVTTTGIGAAELILTGVDLDAADKIGVYKNTVHTIGYSLDKALGTKSLARIGNFTNIIVNFGVGARIGVAGEFQAGIFRQLFSAIIMGIAAEADILEHKLKGTALYKISKNRDLLDDPVMMNQAMTEIIQYKDSPAIKMALEHLERKIVQETERQKYLVRRDKYVKELELRQAIELKAKKAKEKK